MGIIGSANEDMLLSSAIFTLQKERDAAISLVSSLDAGITCLQRRMDELVDAENQKLAEEERQRGILLPAVCSECGRELATDDNSRTWLRQTKWRCEWEKGGPVDCGGTFALKE